MERGNYQTKQKLSILSILKEEQNYSLSIDKILELCEHKNIQVGKTTIYRLLESCVTSFEARRIFNDATKCYEYQYLENKDACMHHLHLKCRLCGKVVHLDCKATEEFVNHIEREHGFVMDQWNSILSGTCEDCRRKRNGVIQ